MVISDVAQTYATFRRKTPPLDVSAHTDNQESPFNFGTDEFHKVMKFRGFFDRLASNKERMKRDAGSSETDFEPNVSLCRAATKAKPL